MGWFGQVCGCYSHEAEVYFCYNNSFLLLESASAPVFRFFHSHSLTRHSLTHSLTHLLTHSLTHDFSLTHSLHSLARSLAHSLTHSLIHSPTHSLTTSHSRLHTFVWLWVFLAHSHALTHSLRFPSSRSLSGVYRSRCVAHALSIVFLGGKCWAPRDTQRDAHVCSSSSSSSI